MIGFRLWLGFLASLFGVFISATCQAADKPNILWITSEDNGPHLGCYGDKYAITPNLDALASRGMLYTNASSNAPVCAPARTTIISGLYPPATGGEHMRSHARLPEGFRMYPQFLREAGYYCTNNSKEDYNLAKPGKVWDQSNRRAHYKRRSKGQPFFAIFNHTISHESQIRNKIEDSERTHDPAKARVPAYHPDTPEVRRNWAQYYDRITLMDKRVGANLRELSDAELDEDTIVFYYGDHGSGMPRSKRWPYNSGLHVPLIVHFPEKWKHLAPADYKPGGSSDRPVGFVDLAPTVLSLAGVEPAEWMQGRAFAGSHQQPGRDYNFGFRGRMDERYDCVRSVRDKRYMYIKNYMPHRPYGQFVGYMFQTQTTQVWNRLFRQGKLNAAQSAFWKPKPAEELYDLQADPDEVLNLVNSAEHAGKLAELRRAHHDWAKRIRDVGLLSEWEMHERSKGMTPYELGRDREKFDFDAIFEAATTATSMNAEDLPAVRKMLSSEDSGVRYWGAVGLLAHGERGYKSARQVLVEALKDESPIVRITAAESLGRYGSDAEKRDVLPLLLKYASPDQNVFLGIAAWNVIDQLDETARPLLPQLKALSPKPTSAPPRTDGYSGRLKIKTLADLED